MPNLDVSDLLLDPDFAEELTIFRRAMTVGSNGRSTLASVEVEPKPWGVVLPVDTAVGGNSMTRSSDAQYRGSAWVIYTQHRLQGPSDDPDRYPDVVMIEGDPYVVTIVNAYSKFGAGFMKAEVSSMAAIDNAPT